MEREPLLPFAFNIRFGFCQFAQNVSMHGSLGVYPWWLSFLDLYIHVFDEIWNVFKIISSNIVSSFSHFSSWDTHNVYVALLDSVPKILQVLFTCLHSFFFIHYLHSFVLLRLDHFNRPIFKFVDSFFCLLQSAFEPSGEFFLSVIVLSTLEFQFFKNNLYLFIDIVNLFIHHFPDFLLFFVHVFLWWFDHILYNFKNLCLVTLISGLPQGQFQLILLPCLSHTFMFLCVP